MQWRRTDSELQHPAAIDEYTVDNSQMILNRKLSVFVIFTIIAILGTLIYSKTLHSPFIFDDMPNILENPDIRMTDVSVSKIIKAAKSRGSDRPLANISFAINYRLHQYDTFGYHITNLLIHIITAFLVFLVAGQTMALLNQKGILIPALAAACWLTNPVHSQSVSYIVQRMNSQAALFYMLSLFLYIKARSVRSDDTTITARPRLLFSASILAGICALGSKQVAGTLPIFIFLYEWYFFQNLDINWLKQKLKWILVPGSVFAIIALIYLGASPFEKIISMYDKQSFTMAQRLLTEPRVVLYYLALLFFPHPGRLNLDYSYSLSTSLIDPVATIFSITALAALLTMTIFTAKKHRLLSFAILWFLGNLVVESSFIGLALIFEHRTYLPSIFIFIAVTAIILRAIKVRPVAVVVLCIFIGISGFWTYQRNNIWKNENTLWPDCLSKAPNNERVYNNLGMIEFNQGKFKKAIPLFVKSLELAPRYDDAHKNLAAAYSRTGDFSAALVHCEKALAENPGDITTINILGVAYLSQGNLEQSKKYFLQIIRNDKNFFEAHMNLGIIYERQKNPDMAIEYYTKAVRIHPTSTDARRHLGRLLAMTGDLEAAQPHLQAALKSDPDNPQTHNMLGNIALQKKSFGAAISHYQKALQLSPAYKAAHTNLARALSMNNQPSEAVAAMEKAVILFPNDDSLIINLAMMYAGNNLTDQAIEQFKAAAELISDNAVIFYNLACLYARQDNKDQTIEYLKKAISKGYDKMDKIRTDPDLENIRQTEYYKNLVTGRPMAK